MNPRSIAIVMSGCAISFLAGWGTHSVMVDTRGGTKDGPAADGSVQARRRTPDDESTKLAARWMERLDRDDARQVAGEMPPGELRTVIDGVMDGVWGDLSTADRKKLEALIGQWALHDPDAAVAWARGLRHPQQREVGLTYIAAALAESDPQRAFNIFAEQEKITLWLGRDQLEALITKLTGEAVAKGPQALLDLQRRIPQNETNGILIVDVTYPDGFDYAAMLDGLVESKKSGQADWPYQISSPLGQWAVKDPDAAFSYISAKAGEGHRFRFYDLTEKLEGKWGATATNEWLGQKISSLDPVARKSFLEQSGILNSPGSLVRVINGVTDTAAANELRFEAIQSTASTTPRNFEVLADLPTDEKIAIISRLRGLKHTDLLRSVMEKWEIPQVEMVRLLESAKLP